MATWVASALKWLSNMAKRMGLTVLAGLMTVTAFGCTGPSVTAAVIEDRTYTITPVSVKVKAGMIAGEIAEMKVTERIEKGSDRVVSPAKLTGTLKLKNTSTNQSVRLVAGKLQYIDGQGQLITLEATRTESPLKFSSYGNERLDPGQEASQSLDLEFPADALKAKKIKEIRLELAYIPAPYQEASVNFPVSIGDGK